MSANEDLAARFEVGQGSEELLGKFNSADRSRDSWISKGVNASVYQALTVIK
jgi:hypothetical protein